MVDIGALRARLTPARRAPKDPGEAADRAGLAAALDRLPGARGAMAAFVAGETLAEAVQAVGQVQAVGMVASLEHLPGDGPSIARLVHLQAIGGLVDADLAPGTDLVVDPRTLQPPTATDEAIRADVAGLCAAAEQAGMTVTLDGQPPAELDRVLAMRAALADEHPDLGVTIAANLHRSEADCLDLAAAGARVRLVRRYTQASQGEGFTRAHDVDRAFVRCMRVLMQGGARTTVATHDDTLLEIAEALAGRTTPAPTVTYQFRRGMLDARAGQLAASGATVCVLVPYGPGWAGYLTTKLALTPTSLAQAVRAAGSRGLGQADHGEQAPR
jgi:proline dehydrogenase